MKELSKPKIAVIGCGYWGKNIINTLHGLKCLDSICDFNNEIAENFANQFKIKSFKLNEIENQKHLDGVCIATPAETHRDIALRLIKLDIPIFIEKPLATSMEDATEIRDAANLNNTIVQVGHLLRYHNGFNEVLKIVNNGGVGDLIHIHSLRKSFGKIRDNENVIWSFAPHDISMILALVKQKPLKIKSYEENALHQGITDNAEIFLDFESCSAKISTSWLSPIKEHKLIVIGSEGAIVFDDTKDWNQKVKLIKNKIITIEDRLEIEKGDEEYISLAEEQPLKNELMHFIDCIENGNIPLTDVSEGVNVIEVLENL